MKQNNKLCGEELLFGQRVGGEVEKSSLSRCTSYLRSGLLDDAERQVLDNFIHCLDKDLAGFKADMPTLRQKLSQLMAVKQSKDTGPPSVYEVDMSTTSHKDTVESGLSLTLQSNSQASMYEEKKRERSPSSSSSNSDEDYYVEFKRLKKKQPLKTTPKRIQKPTRWNQGRSPIRVAPKKQAYYNKPVEQPLPTFYNKDTPDLC
jgi:hypothetical protein